MLFKYFSFENKIMQILSLQITYNKSHPSLKIELKSKRKVNSFHRYTQNPPKRKMLERPCNNEYGCNTNVGATLLSGDVIKKVVNGIVNMDAYRSNKTAIIANWTRHI